MESKSIFFYPNILGRIKNPPVEGRESEPLLGVFLWGLKIVHLLSLGVVLESVAIKNFEASRRGGARFRLAASSF